MLFCSQKKWDEQLRQVLLIALRENREKLEALEKRQTESMEALDKRQTESMEALEKKQEESGRLLRRQAGSLEDILEELQRQGEAAESTAEQLHEVQGREETLVELCCLLSGQREMILRQLLAEGVLAEDVRAGWQRQAELMAQEAERLERQCAFQRIGVCGEKADYDCHEILSVRPAQREGQSGTIAEVYSAGYCYHGKIVKKAQVAVYK